MTAFVGVGFGAPAIVGNKVYLFDRDEKVRDKLGCFDIATGGGVNGIDPLSGKILWTHSHWRCSTPVPHAVDAGEGRVLMTGGYSAGAAVSTPTTRLASEAMGWCA